MSEYFEHLLVFQNRIKVRVVIRSGKTFLYIPYHRQAIQNFSSKNEYHEMEMQFTYLHVTNIYSRMEMDTYTIQARH